MIPVSVLVGKAARFASRFKGGGSAFPGLVVERMDPDFLARMLSRLPRGVVVVSGTNGKTTTTKMVVELLRSQGLRVFTNRSGSNFTRGVVASLVAEADFLGRLDADIAVLELDEAHAVHFVRQFPPQYCLLLNVLRDQLDRFGEIDTTAGFLTTIASRTSKAIVLNREDSRVARIAASESLSGETEVSYFGLAPSLLRLFPSDDDMRSADTLESDYSASAADQDSAGPERPEASVVLEAIDGQHARFSITGTELETDLSLNGIYNIYNAAAALALVQAVLRDEIDHPSLLKALSEVRPAFGRGESFTVNGQPLELVLVKNPSGFRLGLQSFNPAGCASMIAINDNYADGRDMSWLWDVDFDIFREHGVERVTGVRAADMALRLKYDDVATGTVNEDLGRSLDALIAEHPDSPKRIFCTYTAMLALRQELSRYTTVEDFS